MKNPFKKSGATGLALVKEIHEAVLTSGEKCVAEAKAILAATTTQQREKFEMYEKMRKHGFGNVKEIKESTKELEERRLAFERSKIVNDYMFRYPDHKFIATEEMEAVCEKYGLLLGPDKHYTGSMPERSMKRIIDFKLQEADIIYSRGQIKIHKAGVQSSEGTIEWAEIDKETYMRETKNETVYETNGRRTYYASNKDYYTIAAPGDMFEMKGLVQDGVKLKELVECDDPACLKTVRFGYLVVAVWGEEIAIEKLQNPKHN